jgi:hypothetical protein
LAGKPYLKEPVASMNGSGITEEKLTYFLVAGIRGGVTRYIRKKKETSAGDSHGLFAPLS